MWRKTPQTSLIIELLREHGHATNQELTVAAHKQMPGMTATTVHRITARLVAAGMASYASTNGSTKVLDSNTQDHDHFVCRECNKILDINLDDEIIERLQKQIPGKLARKSIVVTGSCDNCDLSIVRA